MSRGSVLPEGVTLEGEIRGQGDLVVAGVVNGPVQIDGHLAIEAGATVRGEVKARSISIRGTLLGPAIADETIRLEPGARMVGDARADRVAVVDGAMLRGRITMTGGQPSRRSSAGGTPAARPTSSGAVIAPTPPRAAAGVIMAPRDEAPSRPYEGDERQTARFLRPSDLAVPRSSAPPAPDALSAEAPPAAIASPAVAAPAVPAPVGARSMPSAPPPQPARARERRPPEPVIPGVGRQRARRKDGGIPS